MNIFGIVVPTPQEMPMSADPLLQPFQLKHLTLRNRLMITSHEPAYPEDGMPKAHAGHAHCTSWHAYMLG